MYKYKNDTMKILRWIAPPFFALLAYATIIVIIEIISSKYKGDTGYGGMFECIAICLLVLLIFPCLCSATLLKDCKHRVCYTLYSSCIFGFGLDIISLLMGNNPGIEWLRISVGLFVWCELGALLGLLRYKTVK